MLRYGDDMVVCHGRLNYFLIFSGRNKLLRYTCSNSYLYPVKQDCKHGFGEYVHIPASVDPKKSNDTRVRWPVCNDQGTHVYLNIVSGKTVRRTGVQNTALPMTRECESGNEECTSDLTVDFASKNEFIESTGVEESNVSTDYSKSTSTSSSSKESTSTSSSSKESSSLGEESSEENLEPEKYPVGRVLLRKFSGHIHQEKVTKYDEDRKYYWIEYDNGDSEELSHKKICKYKSWDQDLGTSSEEESDQDSKRKASERSTRTKTPSHTGATTGVTGVQMERKRDKRLRQNPKKREAENVRFLGTTNGICTNENNIDSKICTNKKSIKNKKGDSQVTCKVSRTVKNKKTESRAKRKVARKRKSKIKNENSDRKDSYT